MQARPRVARRCRTVVLAGRDPEAFSGAAKELTKAGVDPAALELKKNVGAVGGARKGEPATLFAIVALSSVAMTAISIYLAKRRSHVSKSESLTITLPDGTKIEHKIQSTGSAEEIKADVMGKVASLRIPFPKTL